MPRLHIVRQSAGFTLSEVLIAMVVLCIGLLGLSAMTLAMGKSVTFSKQRTQTRYAQVVPGHYPPETYNTIPGYPQFSRSVVVHTDSPLVDTKTVVVTTAWQSPGRGRPHTVTVTTVINKQ
jgi:prepilin-type N-terminal cleavage/methylation domain-containing protein